MQRPESDELFGRVHAFDLPGNADDRRALIEALVEAQYWARMRRGLLIVLSLLSIPVWIAWIAPSLHAGGARLFVTEIGGVIYAGLGLTVGTELIWSRRRRKLLERHAVAAPAIASSPLPSPRPEEPEAPGR